VNPKPPPGYYGLFNDNWAQLFHGAPNEGTDTTPRPFSRETPPGFAFDFNQGSPGDTPDGNRDRLDERLTRSVSVQGSGPDPIAYTASRNGLGIDIKNRPLNSGTSSRFQWVYNDTAPAPGKNVNPAALHELTFALVYQHHNDIEISNRTILGLHQFGFGSAPPLRPTGGSFSLVYQPTASPTTLFFLIAFSSSGFVVANLTAAQDEQLRSEPVPIAVTWGRDTTTRIYFDGAEILESAALSPFNVPGIDWVILGRTDQKENAGANGIYESLIVQGKEWQREEVERWSADPHGWIHGKTPRLLVTPAPTLAPDCVRHRGLDLVPTVQHEGLSLRG
jgi:hypothetical protein